MYNPYIPGTAGYARVSGAEDIPPAKNENVPRERGLSSLLKLLKPDSLDTGDVLLLLILLFLFLEGDDMELVITLGLILLLGIN